MGCQTKCIKRNVRNYLEKLLAIAMLLSLSTIISTLQASAVSSEENAAASSAACGGRDGGGSGGGSGKNDFHLFPFSSQNLFKREREREKREGKTRVFPPLPLDSPSHSSLTHSPSDARFVRGLRAFTVAAAAAAAAAALGAGTFMPSYFLSPTAMCRL